MYITDWPKPPTSMLLTTFRRGEASKSPFECFTTPKFQHLPAVNVPVTSPTPVRVTERFSSTCHPIT